MNQNLSIFTIIELDPAQPPSEHRPNGRNYEMYFIWLVTYMRPFNIDNSYNGSLREVIPSANANPAKILLEACWTEGEAEFQQRAINEKLGFRPILLYDIDLSHYTFSLI
jgi:hypothetical protein